MNREDIIRMAREAGIPLGVRLINSVRSEPCVTAEVERFAVLVAAAEREAVLDLVDAYAKNNADLKAAIRARGNQ